MTHHPPLAPPEPKKSTRSRVFLIVILFLLGSLPCCGILGAIAIPAFLRSVKTSKAAESTMVITRLAHSIKFKTESDASNQPGTCVFPPSLPPTSVIPCEGSKSAVDPVAAQTWKDAGVTPPEEQNYFSYSTRVGEQGDTYEIVATADFDCGGEQHTLTQTLTMEEGCKVVINPAVTLNEFE